MHNARIAKAAKVNSLSLYNPKNIATCGEKIKIKTQKITPFNNKVIIPVLSVFLSRCISFLA